MRTDAVHLGAGMADLEMMMEASVCRVMLRDPVWNTELFIGKNSCSGRWWIGSVARPKAPGGHCCQQSGRLCTSLGTPLMGSGPQFTWF